MARKSPKQKEQVKRQFPDNEQLLALSKQLQDAADLVTEMAEVRIAEDQSTAVKVPYGFLFMYERSDPHISGSWEEEPLGVLRYFCRAFRASTHGQAFQVLLNYISTLHARYAITDLRLDHQVSIAGTDVEIEKLGPPKEVLELLC